MKVIVARRRTVHHDGKDFNAGQELNLPNKEAERLHALGFVTMPGVDQAPMSEGPKVLTGNAATVEEKPGV